MAAPMSQSKSDLLSAFERFALYEMMLSGFDPMVRKFVIMTYQDYDGQPSRPRLLNICMKFSLRYQYSGQIE